MQKKECSKFPKGFFTKPRTTISMKEALSGVKPFFKTFYLISK